jgi:hypothetical protein
MIHFISHNTNKLKEKRKRKKRGGEYSMMADTSQCVLGIYCYQPKIFSC